MVRRKKKVEIEFNHIKSNLAFKNSNWCKQCPIRLYNNSEDKVMFGIGNIFTDTIIILPNYDVNAKLGYTTMLNIVVDCYSKITNSDIFEKYYITRYIKCLNKTEYNLNDIAIQCCYKYLYYEINRIKPKRIITFDSKYSNYLSNNWGIKIINVISPGVMFYDNDKLKDKFMEQFKEVLCNDS